MSRPQLNATDEELDQLIQSYQMFVQLAKYFEELIVPTKALDIAWHAHQVNLQ